MLSLSTIFAFGLVVVNQQPQTEGILVYYFALMILKESLYEPPLCRVAMSELSLEAQEDEKVLYPMIALGNVFECLTNIFILYLVGYLIDESTNSLT